MCSEVSTIETCLKKFSVLFELGTTAPRLQILVLHILHVLFTLVPDTPLVDLLIFFVNSPYLIRIFILVADGGSIMKACQLSFLRAIMSEYLNEHSSSTA